MGPDYWDELVAGTVAGKRWVAAFDVLGGLGPFCERLHRQGAEGVFIIAGSRGTGDEPGPGLARWRLLGIEAHTVMESIRSFESALTDVPTEVVDALNDFDPDGSARVYRNVFAVDHPVGNRRSYGCRPAAWAELENKTTIDAFWDAAGVRRAPSEIVAANSDSLGAAAKRLDQGMGTVWVGDNREGWHGAGEYLRWARDDESTLAAGEFISQHCDTARVMPFLDGIPCSIHGMVIDDDVIVFRPVELVILRRDDARLLYSGASTAWDPPDADREYMRDVARRVGGFLRDSMSYRGSFNLDGVLTAEGWLPTELNARFSNGLAMLQRGFAVPLYHLHLTIVEGEGLDYQPRELERQLVAAADEERSIGAGAPLSMRVTESFEAEVVFEGDLARLASVDEEAHGSIQLGPSPSGSYFRMTVEHAHHREGESIAPKAVAAFALADAEWGTDIGSLYAAPEARG